MKRLRSIWNTFLLKIQNASASRQQFILEKLSGLCVLFDMGEYSRISCELDQNCMSIWILRSLIQSIWIRCMKIYWNRFGMMKHMTLCGRGKDGKRLKRNGTNNFFRNGYSFLSVDFIVQLYVRIEPYSKRLFLDEVLVIVDIKIIILNCFDV